MMSSDKIFSQRDLERISQENFLNYWKSLGIELIDSEHLIKIISGIKHPLLNFVFSQYNSRGEGAAEIGRTLEFFQKRGLPFSWWVDDKDAPGFYGKLLPEHGLRLLGPFARIAMRMENYVPQPHFMPKNLTISEISKVSDMDLWIDVLQQVFQTPREIAEQYGALVGGQGFCGKNGLYHYLGRIDEKPVATGTLIVQNGIAGIYNVLVITEVRRLGIASSMLLQILEAAIQLECHTAVLQTTAVSAYLYQRMGFNLVGGTQVYFIS